MPTTGAVLPHAPSEAFALASGRDEKYAIIQLMMCMTAGKGHGLAGAGGAGSGDGAGEGLTFVLILLAESY